MTVSPRHDLTEPQEKALVEFHRQEGDFAFLVSELRPGDNVKHYHSVFQSRTTNAATTRKKIERRLVAADLEIEVKVTVKVKTCSDLIGWFHYLTKDTDYVRLLIKGWQMTWIKEQCLANVRKIPHSVLLKSKHHITSKGATARILAYAKAKDWPITGKESFKQIVCQMASEGYEFQNIKVKWCFAQCLAMSGNHKAMCSLIDMELQFLDD